MTLSSTSPLLLLLAIPLLAETPAAWTPEYSMKVQTVAEVEASPDGHMAVWTQTKAIIETEKSERLTHIFIGGSDGTGRMQLTRGDKSATSPAFSRDGKSVFFASERNGKRNIFQIAIDGGEAEALTDWKGVLGQYSLSPNGKWIAFTGTEADPNEEKSKIGKTDFRVVDEAAKNHGLWLIPVPADIHGKHPARKLVQGAYHVSAVAWSPDSLQIAYETRPTPDADDGSKSDISEVDVETGNSRPLAATQAAESEPHYSPDGRYLAYVRGSNPRSALGGNRIVLLLRKTGVGRDLPATYDESPALVGWAPNSTKIYFLEAKGTKSVFYAMPVDGPAVATYSGVLGSGAKLNQTGTAVAFTQQASDQPIEAYVMDLASKHPLQVSAANTDLGKPPLGKTELIRWKSKDGKEIEGLLTYPVNYQKGTKYPLILNIHGGPAGAFNENFIGAGGLYPIATFASKGYAVLRCNIRGSSAYGRNFRAANLNDWGGGDFNDLMTGVDHVIAIGVADPNRMAVMGWSYGGYMTNWVVTQTNRFKAAATGAGLSNMISMWGTNDIPSILDDYFSGPSYAETDRYIKQSPLFHINNARTPLLILHGEQDIRVPTTQGYEMYRALQRKGVPVEMVVYPRTQHGPQEPKFVLDIMKRHIAWVEKYLGAPATAVDKAVN